MDTPDDPDQKLQGIDAADLLARALESGKPATGNPRVWTPPAPEVLAQLLPQYRIERLIGHGGMGAVYKGVQPALDRPVAIKLLPAELVAKDDFFTRFEREAKVLARLQHSGIVTVYDFGLTTDGHPYIVMEFVDGTDLARLIGMGSLTTAQALELTIQICEALNYAHGQGVIHRDIKPANILVTKDGRAKVADFGLARPMDEEAEGRLTRSNMIMGTPAYMAPEQYMGLSDQRADIFALGVLLYEMLTGKRPEGAFDPPSVKVRLDVRLDQVVLKAMRQEPERRYQLASEMGAEVDHIRKTPLPKERVGGKPVPQRGKGKKAAKIPPLGIAAAIFFPLIAIGGLMAWIELDDKPAKSEKVPGTAPADPLDVHATAKAATKAIVLTTTAPPFSATKDKAFENSLGMKFVPVPITGGPTDGQRVLFSVWDTRVQDYEVFAKATYRTLEKPDFEQGATHPVVNVSWYDAQAFCTWLTERDREAGNLPASYNYRLPSDHEWSCAVGIGEREDAAKTPEEKDAKVDNVFPWGSQWAPPPGGGNYAGEELKPAQASGKYTFIKDVISGYNDGFVSASPVGSFAANRFGLFDMGGNVWQWCEDSWNTERVLRGGCWNNWQHGYLLSSGRIHSTPALHNDYDGFRCVLVSDPTRPLQKTIALVPPTPATPTKVQAFTNSLGMKFVPVPITGGPTDGEKVLFSIWETRVQDYEVFAKETKREWPRPPFEQGKSHPAVDVTLDDAHSFCAWLSDRERKSGVLAATQAYRLPTDHEWSCAAGLADRDIADLPPKEKSGVPPDQFPWGKSWPPPAGAGNLCGTETLGSGKTYLPKALVGYRDGFIETAPVGSFASDQFGLYDVAGNVWEFVEDWHDQEKQRRVLRGGSFERCEPADLTSSRRLSSSAQFRGIDCGFRIVLIQVPSLHPSPEPNGTTASPFEATKNAPFENSLGMKFVPVPETHVLFSIWDTRVQDYEAFATASKREWPKAEFEQGPSHPAVRVGWSDARAFCEWLTRREQAEGKDRTKRRLPAPVE